jgi:hypothetical protein
MVEFPPEFHLPVPQFELHAPHIRTILISVGSSQRPRCQCPAHSKPGIDAGSSQPGSQ